MGPSRRGRAVSAMLTLLLMVAGTACSSDDDGTNAPYLSLNNCTSCHTSSARLLATAEPEPTGSENPGEG